MARCVACGEMISGSYFEALGGLWHAGCFNCAVCGQAIRGGRMAQQGGRPVHPECHAEQHALVCSACGQGIVGTLVEALGKRFHPHCFRCAHCGKAMGDARFINDGDDALHVHCYHARHSPPCVVCGGPIRTPSHYTNAWGECHCANHEQELPKCFCCFRLISPLSSRGGHRLRDGRHLCGLCEGEGVVNSMAEAEALLPRVKAFMAELGMDLGEVPLPITLTDQRTIFQMGSQESPRPPTGLLRTRILTTPGGQQVREMEKIYILFGLTREHFQVIAVHELTHAWLFLHQFYNLPGEVEEGLCVWMEYRWLAGLDTPKADFRRRLLEEEKDPIYGGGFQKARSALNRLDLPELLDYVRVNGRFPGMARGAGRLFDAFA